MARVNTGVRQGSILGSLLIDGLIDSLEFIVTKQPQG